MLLVNDCGYSVLEHQLGVLVEARPSAGEWVWPAVVQGQPNLLLEASWTGSARGPGAKQGLPL